MQELLEELAVVVGRCALQVMNTNIIPSSVTAMKTLTTCEGG